MTEISYFSNLPDYLLNEILLFDKRFILRKGKMITIGEIAKEDPRRDLILNCPRIEFGVSIYSWVYLPISEEKSYTMFYYFEENTKYISFTDDMVGTYSVTEI